MKETIHPKYDRMIMRCVCGNEIHTRSTVNGKDGVVNMEICSACHPFYTGKQKLVDSAGRVERFRRIYGIKFAIIVMNPNLSIAKVKVLKVQILHMLEPCLPVSLVCFYNCFLGISNRAKIEALEQEIENQNRIYVLFLLHRIIE